MDLEDLLREDRSKRIIDSRFFQVFCFLLAFVGIGCLIASVVIFVINRITRVSVNNLPTIRADFGVKPNKTGTVMTSSVADGSVPYVSSAGSVFDAIEYCKILKCKGFIYDYSNHQVKILAENSPIVESTDSDVYYRQIDYV